MRFRGLVLAAGIVAVVSLVGASVAAATVSLGQTSSQEPTATTVGGFTEVNLSTVFNEQGIIFKGQTGPKGQSLGGGQGFDIEANTFPSTGNFTVSAGSVHPTFLIPAYAAGINSVLGLGKAVSIPVPPGRYTSVWLMYMTEGPAAGALTLKYSNGTTTSDPFTFSGFFANPVNPPQFQVYNVPNTLYEGHNACVKLTFCTHSGITDGTVDPSNSGGNGWIHGYVLPANSSLTLACLEFPAEPANSSTPLSDATIFAISLEDAPGFTPGSAVASSSSCGTSAATTTATSSSASSASTAATTTSSTTSTSTSASSSTSSSAASTASSLTSRSKSSSLPKTGQGPFVGLAGVLLLLAGVGCLIRARTALNPRR